jgi:hypothetical protein
MLIKPLIRISVLLAIIMTNIGCDQISKNMVRERIEPGVQIPIIENHVILTKVSRHQAVDAPAYAVFGLVYGDDLAVFSKKFRPNRGFQPRVHNWRRHWKYI